MINTYAGNGHEVSLESGFKELEFEDGNWLYKDRYIGFFQSWGKKLFGIIKNHFGTKFMAVG